MIRCAGRSTSSSVTRSGLRVPAHRLPPTMTQCGPTTMASTPGQTATRRQSKPRTAYKHIPHRDKPPHLVARRNARERRRVQAVNSAFLRLRRHLPHPVVGKHKRLSKVTISQPAGYCGPDVGQTFCMIWKDTRLSFCHLRTVHESDR